MRRLALVSAVLILGFAGPAAAQGPSLLDWSQTAARGMFDLCREDAPDAARVAEHGEVWGWPTFAGYLEHPEGYKREAGGESRRTYQVGDNSAYVEVTVQSGQVTAAAPADIRYFRCNVASDQPVNGDLKAYFTGVYGPPATVADGATVWLTGAAKASSGADDDAALKAVQAAGVGAQGLRVALITEDGVDEAKLSIFRNVPPS